jgi:putative transposase
MRYADGKVRKTRIAYDEPGHAHELTFSCYRGLTMLGKDRTRLWLVQALDDARQRRAFDLWAYVIMPEHAHVLILPRRSDYRIAMILKAIKQPVARKAMAYLRAATPHWMERLKVAKPDGRVEYRFWQQGGGYDRNIHTAETAWAAVEYIHNNPVRRGLADCATAWEWSSAGWYAGDAHVRLKMDDRPPDPPMR